MGQLERDDLDCPMFKIRKECKNEYIEQTGAQIR